MSIEETIVSLYERGSTDAGAALEAWRDTSEAWEIAPRLLDDDNALVRFFGANTLYSKIQRNWSELDDTQQLSLWQGLLTVAASHSSSDTKQVNTQLALALAGLIVRANQQHTETLLNQLTSLEEASVMYGVLQHIPEELDGAVLAHGVRTALVAALRTRVPLLLRGVVAVLRADDNDDDATAAVLLLGCVAAWLASGIAPPTAVLNEVEMVRLILTRLDASKELFEAGASALLAAVARPTSFSSARMLAASDATSFGAATSLIAQRLAQLAPMYDAAVEQEDDALARAYADLVFGLIERQSSLIVAGGDGGETLIQLGLHCCGVGTRSVAERGIDAWLALGEAVERSGAVQAGDNGAATVLQLLIVAPLTTAVRRCARDAADEDEPRDEAARRTALASYDELIAYRSRVADLVEASLSLLGEDALLAVLGDVPADACFDVLSRVGMSLRRHTITGGALAALCDAALQIVTDIAQQRQQEPRKWIGTCRSAFHFLAIVAERLDVRTPPCAAAALSALADPDTPPTVCDAAVRCLLGVSTSPAGALHACAEQVLTACGDTLTAAAHLTVSQRVGIARSATQISALALGSSVAPLALLRPLVEASVARCHVAVEANSVAPLSHELRVLAQLVDVPQLPDAALPLLACAVPLIDALLQHSPHLVQRADVATPIAAAIERCVVAAGTEAEMSLEMLFDRLMQLFEASGASSCVDAMASACRSKQAVGARQAALRVALLANVLSRTAAPLADNPVDCATLLASVLTLTSTVAAAAPAALLTDDCANTAVGLACTTLVAAATTASVSTSAVPLVRAEVAASMVIALLLGLGKQASASLQYIANDSNAQQALDALRQRWLVQATQSMLPAALAAGVASVARRHATALYAALTLAGEHAPSLLANQLDGAERLDDESRQRVIVLLLSLVTSGQERRFCAMMRDVGRLINGEMTLDVLVAYEM